MTRDLRRAAATMVVAIGLISLLYVNPIYQTAGPRTILWLYDLTVVASALAGLGLSFLLWRSFGRGEVLQKIWGSLTLGFLLWTIGEVIWSYDQLLAGNHLPYPSLADVAWIAGYITVAVGLFLRYRSLQMTPSKGWRGVVLWVLVTLATLIVAIVAVPIVATSGPVSLIEETVNVLYPIGDLALAIGALLIALVLIGGALSVPWGLIAAGCFCVAASDLLYASAVWHGTYQVASTGGVNLLTFIVNILYAASYLIMDTGLYMQARLQKVI
jgi:hypothetical protein